MNDTEKPSAKATSIADQSDAIVVSFACDWYQPLLERRFRSVIRKRVPKTLDAKWLYFHVNAPISAITARAPIRAVEQINRAQAVAIAKDLALSSAEIEAYLAADSTIGCYRLGPIEFPHKAVPIAEVSKHMVYHPPQSFFIVSRQAKTVIDNLAGFGSSRPHPTKSKKP